MSHTVGRSHRQLRTPLTKRQYHGCEIYDRDAAKHACRHLYPTRRRTTSP